MLDAAGIDPALWPEVVASTDVLGPLTPSAARELGLSTSVLVVAGGGDGPMANVAAASLAPEDAGYVCLGTSAWYATTTTAPIADPAQRGFTYRHIVPGLFAPCATTQADGDHELWPVSVIGGGANSDAWLQVFADLWGVPVQRRAVTTGATALGAAVTGLVGLGRTDFTVARDRAPVTATFEPRPDFTDRRELEERYVALYAALEGWFRNSAEA